MFFSCIFFFYFFFYFFIGHCVCWHVSQIVRRPSVVRFCCCWIYTYIRIYGERHISYHNLWWHAMLCALPFDASFLMLLLLLLPCHPKYPSICCLCCPSVNCCAHQFDVVNFVKIYRLLPSKFDIVMQFVSRIWMYKYEKQLTTLLVFPCCLDSKEIIQIRIQFDFFARQ